MVDETWRCNIDKDGQSRQVVISMLGDGLWTCSVIPLVQMSYNTSVIKTNLGTILKEV